MKVLVVDDEPLARQRLTRMLQAVEGVELVGEAADGRAALDQVGKLSPDLVIMDIRMPGMDGVTAARELAASPEPPAVIFCTAYDEYAIAAFEAEAVGYLLKPIKQQQLEEAVARAQRVNRAQLAALPGQDLEMPEESAMLKAHSHHGIELLPIGRVRCLVADNKYVTAVYDGGELLIDDSLKELEQKFPGRFRRIHRGALVATDYLQGLERDGAGGWRVRLSGVDVAPAVSRRHLAELRRLMEQL